MRAPVLLTVLLSTVQLFAEIPISRPEIGPIDTATYSANTVDVAAGDGILVAWTEGLWSAWPGPVKFRTYADDGTARQALPVEVETGHSPQAFWNGSEYVVVYGLPISRFGSIVPIPAIVSVRVRANGELVPDSKTILATSRSSAGILDVQWDGAKAFALALTSEGTRLLTLDRDGKLLDDTRLDYAATGIAIKPGGGAFVLRSELGDAIAAGDPGFAVLDHTSDGSTTVILLDAAGAERERFVLSSDSFFRASIAWDGRAWVAVYGQPEALCTARFTSAANVGRDCIDEKGASSPALAAGSRGVFKAWIRNGQVITDAGLATTAFSAATSPSAVVDEEGLLVAWLETAFDGMRIHLGGIQNDGSPRAEHTIGGNARYFPPVLSRAGNRTLLVWRDDSTNNAHLVLLERDGAPASNAVELEPFTYATPAVAARGDGWVVAWLSEHGIRSARVSRELQIDNLQDFSGAAEQGAPAIAANAAGYVVVWRENEPPRVRLVVEPLNADGRRTTGGNRLIDDENAPINLPAIGCGPETCLVTWFGTSHELWSALVRHDGTRIGADRMIPTDASATPAVIDALADGSFRVYHGNAITSFSRTGEPGPTQLWHASPLAVGSVVTWRGNPTVVYARWNGQAAQVFAQELPPRSRAVRH